MVCDFFYSYNTKNTILDSKCKLFDMPLNGIQNPSKVNLIIAPLISAPLIALDNKYFWVINASNIAYRDMILNVHLVLHFLSLINQRSLTLLFQQKTHLMIQKVYNVWDIAFTV